MARNDSIEFGKPLKSHKTDIPGLLIFDIPVHGDNRGWFKENWQREKKLNIGLPDFGPVQNNISYNLKRGTTRGIHAEPWDKFISIASGSVFVAIVDLREGPTFGHVETFTLDPSKAIFVPWGCGNSFQTLEDDTVYTYLVNDHWFPEAQYTFLNLGDPSVNIQWPIPLEDAEVSEKDKQHPYFEDVVPMKPRKIFIAGANGQLGLALRKLYPEAEYVDRDTFDISDPAAYAGRNWRLYDIIINAAAYTAVDVAETENGRRDAWQANANAVQLLARIASDNNITLVHISSDYVFDGTISPHTETELFTPLGIYGQSKAAGDLAAATAPRHYIIRTSWVIGEGKNFVATMRNLANNEVDPQVVNDQFGRLTFTTDLAAAIKHLFDTDQAYGTYNFTGDGDVVSWADVAKEVYQLSGHKPSRVTPVSTEDYYADNEGTVAPRPRQSAMALDKIKATGLKPRDWRIALKEYLG